jgi:molybdopterin molybdotransferase
MKVIGFSGFSGSGKTTLIEQLIVHLRRDGRRVSVIKHAHHAFDIDQPGKDSWRHRAAGAFEVVVASRRRLAKIREYEVEGEPTAHQLLAELCDCDWVLVEGFKHSDLPKIEVWRAANAKPAQYHDDPFVVAIATDSPLALPMPTALPVLDLNDPAAVARFLFENTARFDYLSPRFMTNPTPAPRPMLSLEQAVQQLLAATPALTETERLPTGDALGRVLAEEVCSLLDVPPHDNSAMDGYALRAADVPAVGTELRVSQRIAAGQIGVALEPGSAARIFTGAPVPAGADAVVMQEHCEAGPAGARVRIDAMPVAGHWIRRRGEDVRQGSVVVARGARLHPQALGLAAAVGAATLTVLRRPRVALFSTGDELVMPGQPLPPGAIYNSNRFTLHALLQAQGCEVIDLGIVADRLDATRAALRRAAEGSDLILSCGGVSVGEEDHLKPAVQAEGRLELWQVAIKPGKPLAFGAVRRGEGGGEALFIGLPGNPVSAFVTFLLCVRPVLLALQGQAQSAPRAVEAEAGFDWPRPDRRREFLRARRAADGRLELFANQSSGVLSSVVWAEGLIDNPPGRAIARGELVRFIPFAELLSN